MKPFGAFVLEKGQLSETRNSVVLVLNNDTNTRNCAQAKKIQGRH